MRNALSTWKWSLAVVGRSALALVALAAAAAAELFAAYRWLWFPAESARYLMVFGLLWALVLFVILSAWIAALATAASDAAATGARSIDVRRLVRLSKSDILRTGAFVILGALVSAKICFIFSWINNHSLEVASFLTFRSEKPIAPETIESVFEWIELVLWVVAIGFLLGFLLALLRQGWRAALRSVPRLLAGACWRAPFLTGLITLILFGGLACLLVAWHPTVPPGFLDFAQVIIRNGLALGVAVAGWLFWVLSLTKFHAAPSKPSDIAGIERAPNVSDF